MIDSEGNTPNSSDDEEQAGDLDVNRVAGGVGAEIEQDISSDGDGEDQDETNQVRRSPRLIALQQEAERLRWQRIEEEFNLHWEIARRDAVLREVERLEARRRALEAERIRDEAILADLERQAGASGESEGSEKEEDGNE